MSAVKRRTNNMAYTNSPLVSYTKLSPNHSGQRTHNIVLAVLPIARFHP